MYIISYYAIQQVADRYLQTKLQNNMYIFEQDLPDFPGNTKFRTKNYSEHTNNLANRSKDTAVLGW